MPYISPTTSLLRTLDQRGIQNMDAYYDPAFDTALSHDQKQDTLFPHNHPYPPSKHAYSATPLAPPSSKPNNPEMHTQEYHNIPHK